MTSLYHEIIIRHHIMTSLYNDIILIWHHTMTSLYNEIIIQWHHTMTSLYNEIIIQWHHCIMKSYKTSLYNDHCIISSYNDITVQRHHTMYMYRICLLVILPLTSARWWLYPAWAQVLAASQHTSCEWNNQLYTCLATAVAEDMHTRYWMAYEGQAYHKMYWVRWFLVSLF